MNRIKKSIILSFVILFSSYFANAHTINYELDKLSDGDLFSNYLQQGFTHIIPLGLDHILFILCVFFLNTGRFS